MNLDGWHLRNIFNSKLTEENFKMLVKINYDCRRCLHILFLFGLVSWHINPCRLFNAKSCLYIYIKYILFGLVRFYGISTIIGYLMPNPLYTYILKYILFGFVGFYGISTIVDYLKPNSLYTYILNIYDLVLVGFYVISTIVGYLKPNPLYTYIFNICDLVWLGFMAYQPL